MCPQHDRVTARQAVMQRSTAVRRVTPSAATGPDTDLETRRVLPDCALRAIGVGDALLVPAGVPVTLSHLALVCRHRRYRRPFTRLLYVHLMGDIVGQGGVSAGVRDLGLVLMDERKNAGRGHLHMEAPRLVVPGQLVRTNPRLDMLAPNFFDLTGRQGVDRKTAFLAGLEKAVIVPFIRWLTVARKHRRLVVVDRRWRRRTAGCIAISRAIRSGSRRFF